MRKPLATLIAISVLGLGAVGFQDSGNSTKPADAQVVEEIPPPPTTTTLPEGKIIVNGEIQDHPAFKDGCWDSTGFPHSPGGNHGLGECLAKELKGWTGAEFVCLSRLWGPLEGSWNQHADNPFSTAHGIPQALPGSKMGPGWRFDVRRQITWGLTVYIPDRYGTPCKALTFRLKRGWY